MINFEKEILYQYNHSFESKYIVDNDEDFNTLKKINFDSKDRFILLIDSNVNKIWGKKIKDSLSQNNKEIITKVLEANEFTKSISFLPEIVNYLESISCSKNDLIIGCGGGSILDLVAFLSSVYMRGVSFMAIPSTLIGQVDVLTAGKTCLNSYNGKNVLGSFYYAELVYNNSQILNTCSKLIHRQGLSEVFKYGLLSSNELLSSLSRYSESGSSTDLFDTILLTMNSRFNISKIDPLASNLGHTFGHALEKMFEYKILHGDAISIGTVISLYFSHEKGILSKSNLDKIINKMQKLRLNIYIQEDIDIKKLVSLMSKDKKSTKGKINLVLLEDIAKPYIKNDTPFFASNMDEIEEFMIKFLESYQFKTKDLLTLLKTI